MGEVFISREMQISEENEVIKYFRQMAPSRRLGTPDDIAKAALFLASDDSSFITGHALVVDGGITIGSPMDPQRLRAFAEEILKK